MKFFENMKKDDKFVIKILGFSIVEQKLDYKTAKRKQKFLGGLVTTEKTKDCKTNCVDKEIKLFDFPIIRKSEGNNFREYYFFGKIVKKISVFEIFKKNTFKYFNKRYDDIYILRANSGEVYLTLTYLIDKLIERNHSKNPLLVATKKYHIDLIKMICPDIPYVYIKKWRVEPTGLEFKIENFRFFYLFDNPYFQNVEYDINHRPLGEVHYFKSILDKLNIGYNDISMRKIKVPSDDELSMEAKIVKTGLNLDNFVFISPEAESCKLYDEDFWCELINRFKEEGYDVFVNLVKKDVDLDYAMDFKSCGLTFAEAFVLARRAKKIISLRSGFTEFLLQTGVPMDVLYTKFKHRHFLNDMDIYHVMAGFALFQIPFVNKDKIREINTYEISQKECMEKILESM